MNTRIFYDSALAVDRRWTRYLILDRCAVNDLTDHCLIDDLDLENLAKKDLYLISFERPSNFLRDKDPGKRRPKQ